MLMIENLILDNISQTELLYLLLFFCNLKKTKQKQIFFALNTKNYVFNQIIMIFPSNLYKI